MLRRFFPFTINQGGGYVYPSIGSPDHGYSFRRLNSSYVGPLCRVQLPDLSTETDVGSGVDFITVSDFETLASGGTLRLVGFYDQYGSDDLFAETTVYSDICSSGICYEFNGKPAVFELDRYIFGASANVLLRNTGSDIYNSIHYVLSGATIGATLKILVQSDVSNTYGLVCDDASTSTTLSANYTQTTPQAFSWVRNDAQVTPSNRDDIHTELNLGGIYSENYIGFVSGRTPKLGGQLYDGLNCNFCEFIVYNGAGGDFSVANSISINDQLNLYYQAY